MPLISGSSKEAVKTNIRELYKASKNKPEKAKRKPRQIVAIALSKAGKKYKKERQLF